MTKKTLVTATLLALLMSLPVSAIETKKFSGKGQSSLPVVTEVAEEPQDDREPPKRPDVKVKASASTQTDLRFHSYPEDTPFTKDDHNTNFEVRRARVDLSGSVGKIYNGKVSLELGSGNAKLKDAYINYKFFDPVHIQVGQFNVPFGNEATGSSMAQEFVEDSSIANTINAGRDRGILVRGNAFDGIFTYDAGIINGSGENVAENNESMDFVMRTVVGSPPDSESFFQYWLGFSFTSGSQKASDDDSIKLTTETVGGTTLFRANLPADEKYSRTRYGFDATTLIGTGMLKFEYLFADFDFTQSATISGGSVMASIFLTGEQRAVKKSFFIHQTVESPFDWGAGGFGALELAIRYSWFNVDSAFFTANGLLDGWEAVSASKYTDSGYALTTGVNWYPEERVRVMFNWVNAFADMPESAASTESSKGTKSIHQAFLLRFQLAM